MATPIWKQAGYASGFQQPQGWAFSAKEKALMFDNEIDWVTRLGSCLTAVRREAQRKFPSTYTYKAEHKLVTAARLRGRQVFKLKSVFRRCGDCTRERISPHSRGGDID